MPTGRIVSPPFQTKRPGTIAPLVTAHTLPLSGAPEPAEQTGEDDEHEGCQREDDGDQYAVTDEYDNVQVGVGTPQNEENDDTGDGNDEPPPWVETVPECRSVNMTQLRSGPRCVVALCGRPGGCSARPLSLAYR